MLDSAASSCTFFSPSRCSCSASFPAISWRAYRSTKPGSSNGWLMAAFLMTTCSWATGGTGCGAGRGRMSASALQAANRAAMLACPPRPRRHEAGARAGREGWETGTTSGARLGLTRVGASGPLRRAVFHLEFFGASPERSGGFFFDSLSPARAPRRVACATTAWALSAGAASPDRQRSFASGNPTIACWVPG